MIKWMQSNGKYLMAFFGVLLMLVYILPNGSRGGGRGGNDSVRGHMGSLVVYQSDLQRCRNEWEYFNHYAFVPISQYGSTEKSWAPIRVLLSPMAIQQIQHQPYVLMPNQEESALIDLAEVQIQQHPDLFPLLVAEARQMNVGVSRDEVESLLRNIGTRSANSDQIVAIDQSGDPERADTLRACVTDFLTVENAFERAASTIKTSAPLSQYRLATHGQQISLNMVEFLAAPYLVKVPAPTQAEMQKQFDQYANMDPLKADLRTDPFDFGYRYPNRIKLQYISVPRSAVLDAALRVRNQSDQTRYDWDVAAFRYYQAHQTLYAATQPQSSLSLSPESAPAKTIRPFKEVTDEVRQAVLHDDADKLALTIRQRIISQLAADYLTWKNASTENAATTRPVSGVGVAYNSPDYLNRLALMIQKNYGVLPTVVSAGGWQTSATLDSLAGISSATVDDPDMRPLHFADYAMGDYSDFLAPGQPDAANAISLYEPSAALKSDDDNFYLFRITAAEVSHAPANLAEVADQVRSDLQSEAAYKMADGDADKFLVAARTAKSIPAAPRSTNQTVIVAGPINYMQTDPVIGYPTLSPAGLRQFIGSAFDLLALASPGDSHPIGKIPVQLQGRVLVGQVSNIEAMWQPTVPLAMLESEVSVRIRQELATELRSHWFNYDDLVTRTNYQEQKQAAPPTSPAPQQEPNPPLL